MQAGLFVKSLVAALILPFALSACVSLDGTQTRIVGTAANSLPLPPIDDALWRFASAKNEVRSGLSPKQYREEVLTVYLARIDANYADFRSRVSSERRELGLGLDLVVLGFTNYASVARSSIVNNLSAAAAGFAGARGAIDRNVYFDRALPGLLASMDAQRLRLATRIAENRRKSAEEYTLAMAFADLSAYELAGSLDRAIEEVTAQASADRREAQRRYDNAVQACEGEEDVADPTAKIMGFVSRQQVTATAESLETIRSLARLMELPDAGDGDVLHTTISNALIRNYCTRAGLEDLIARIRAQPWGSGIDG